MRYRHVIISRHGGPDVLEIVMDERPEPRAGEVGVRVLATGVAFTDVLIREGLYLGLPKVPFTPGYEIVGIVDQLGSGVAGLDIGQRIAALTVVGGYSEYVCLPAHECVLVPPEVDVAEAVGLVLQYVTAYQLLHRIAKVQSGDRILIHGAAGGVGTALLELGHLAGLKMYGTDSTTKHDLIANLGATPIDYLPENFQPQIRRLTPNGMDVVFDAIGGRHLLGSYQTLAPGGQLISYGFSSALSAHWGRLLKVGESMGLLTLLSIWPDRRSAVFYNITDLKRRQPNWFRDDLTSLLDLLADGSIQPIIADRLPLADAAVAHNLLDHAAVRGQLVLLCDETFRANSSKPERKSSPVDHPSARG
ncbi:medium chain dehydrogenase/reductase family protein [Acaryochloris marina]|uniref:Oxidoreductase, zinc-binding dehydrogenase family protein n=1 Tax=Acaryochloris marina (strain MBIC 11017) TaxID=329726 RepID=A8ZNW3_ACAM1|nr:medium chain dehydrogenase/reductase family protein [Acaryochloris marina]ABW32699.1 oxidoreductase, zinc-binding dehydrogenase family protein [Acaryochloris marina MBIC11017]